ncbi:hypothetical protein PGQ11_010258 [Apiospora arundinis]|uniref:Uncharacterized protein n=1 Tax=Apiospora arundinis TaxID=335852 RepID=A0ABR2I9I0_9PEZI
MDGSVNPQVLYNFDSLNGIHSVNGVNGVSNANSVNNVHGVNGINGGSGSGSYFTDQSTPASLDYRSDAVSPQPQPYYQAPNVMLGQPNVIPDHVHYAQLISKVKENAKCAISHQSETIIDPMERSKVQHILTSPTRVNMETLHATLALPELVPERIANLLGYQAALYGALAHFAQTRQNYDAAGGIELEGEHLVDLVLFATLVYPRLAHLADLLDNPVDHHPVDP